MADIRYEINTSNKDIQKLWNKFGFGPDKSLDREEFSDFMNFVAPKLVISEENYFFNKMDVDKDGLVSLKEIKQRFIENKIPLSSDFSEQMPYLLHELLNMFKTTSEPFEGGE